MENKDKDFKDYVNDLKNVFKKRKHKIENIKMVLTKDIKLRKTIIQVIMNHPPRCGEIKDNLNATKNTVYNYLHQLKELGILDKIPVMTLWNRENLDDDEEEILNKFRDWSSRMTPGQIRKYAGVTHYWQLTELGRDKEIIQWLLRLEENIEKGSEPEKKARVVLTKEQRLTQTKKNIKFFFPNVKKDDIGILAKDFVKKDSSDFFPYMKSRGYDKDG